MVNFLRALKRSKSGASAAEYALIVAVLGGLVVAGATFFGQGLRQGLQDSGAAISATSGTGAVITANTATTTP